MPPENPQLQRRFAVPIDENEIKFLIEDEECKNTKTNTRWAVGMWRKWREERNGLSNSTGNVIPELSKMDAACMDFWLQRFLMEVRNQKGVMNTHLSHYIILPAVCFDICMTLKYLERTSLTIMTIDLYEHARYSTPE